MDFDPVTGNLWDTENGFACCDEINLVERDSIVDGQKYKEFSELNQTDRTEKLGIINETLVKEKLVNFDGKGKYSSPEFTWNYSIGPSAIKFLNSDKLGKQYENDMFVGDVNEQNIYHFDLIENRKALSLNGVLQDRVAEKREELREIIFAEGLGRITDIEVGPDGKFNTFSFME